MSLEFPRMVSIHPHSTSSHSVGNRIAVITSNASLKKHRQL